jgi:hypothetical protein
MQPNANLVWQNFVIAKSGVTSGSLDFHQVVLDLVLTAVGTMCQADGVI